MFFKKEDIYIYLSGFNNLPFPILARKLEMRNIDINPFFIFQFIFKYVMLSDVKEVAD